MPSRQPPLARLAVLAACLAACGDGAEPAASSPAPGVDSGSPADGGALAVDRDATASNGSGDIDASVAPDATATRDAGTARDAGAPRDASVAPDSGPPREAGAGLSPLCQGAATAALQPPPTCDALSGNTTTSRPTNAIYATSWFGCYRTDAGAIVKDPYDNCEFACGSRGLCASGVSGPECQAQLQWFAADADRFGCGTRIKVTNCANGRAVVLAALDRGPNCRSVEQAYGAPVIDMSRPAMTYLFEGRTYGGSDKKRVVAEVVSASTVLGPVD